MSTFLWILGLLLFASSLLAACIMDIREQMVYRFLWLFSGVGAALLLGIRVYADGMQAEWMMELLFFMALQQLWFKRLYGRADCHAYCVCAVAMSGFGLVLIDYVMHMLITFSGLAVVQLLRRNVGRGGRLKKPVALIPYITVAFVVWVDFRCGKWYI